MYQLVYGYIFFIMKTVFISDPKVISAHTQLDQVCKLSYSQRTRIKSDLQ